MRKGTETKTAIRKEALAAASQVGLENLTIGNLAKSLGMSKSGLFSHFTSKESLQIEVLNEAEELFINNVILPALKEPRGEARLRKLFERWLNWDQQKFLPGGCIFITAATEFDDQPGPLRDRVAEVQSNWFAFIARAARIAQEEGQFRADLDDEQFAYEFFSIALGYHMVSRLLKDPKAKQRFTTALEDLFKRSRN
ncbi:MAG: TetR/AcrR family transcriptional regulator [bacterium]|nr:TetR/AcrR family transcriptional regulator [bacterium]